MKSHTWFMEQGYYAWESVLSKKMNYNGSDISRPINSKTTEVFHCLSIPLCSYFSAFDKVEQSTKNSKV